MAFVSSGNHGSAAVTSVTAALLPSAGGAMGAQLPTAAEVTGAATGAEYGSVSNHVLARIAAHSADNVLGEETLSDASFAISADNPSLVPARRPGSLKRDSRSKLHPGKRFAVSLMRSAPSAQHRRASLAIRVA